MDVALRLSFGPGKTGILTNLPVAVAAETIRITCPPIDRGTTIPVRAQPRQHWLNFGEELCSVLLGSAGGKGIGDLAARVIDEDARNSGLGARDVPGCLITAIRISLPVAAKRNPRAGIELDVELGVGTHR